MLGNVCFLSVLKSSLPFWSYFLGHNVPSIKWHFNMFAGVHFVEGKQLSDDERASVFFFKDHWVAPQLSG